MLDVCIYLLLTNKYSVKRTSIFCSVYTVPKHLAFLDYFNVMSPLLWTEIVVG